MYLLTCEDLSGVGGAMGSESVRLIWNKLFHQKQNAKNYVEKYLKKTLKRGQYNLIWNRNYLDTHGPYGFLLQRISPMDKPSRTPTNRWGSP